MLTQVGFSHLVALQNFTPGVDPFCSVNTRIFLDPHIRKTLQPACYSASILIEILVDPYDLFAIQEKKLSSGSLSSGGCDGARPKVVTVKHPESNKPKPTVKKNKPIQADLDVAKEFARCKEEGTVAMSTFSSTANFMLMFKYRKGAPRFI